MKSEQTFIIMKLQQVNEKMVNFNQSLNTLIVTKLV